MTNSRPDSRSSKLDWRHAVVAELAEDANMPEGKTLSKGTPVSLTTHVKWNGQELAFGVPSAPALFLSQSHMANQVSQDKLLLLENTTGPTHDLSSTLYDFFEASIAAIIFAYMALEAFANESIPSDYVYEEHLESGLYRPRVKDWIERRLALEVKLNDILPEVLSKPSPKGLAIWGDYIHLQKFRNKIIHLKTGDRKHSKVWQPFPESIWSRLLAHSHRHYPLIAKKLILHFQAEPLPHWLRYCPF